MVAEDSIPDYKLCGYLCTVLKTTTYSVHPNSPETLEFGTLCQPLTAGSEPGFTSVTGVTLTPIADSNHGDRSTGNGKTEFGEGSSSATSSRNKNKKIKGTVTKNYQTTKKRRNKIGLVRGSMSVVHQIHALVSHKCLKVAARVVGVVPSGDGECGGEMRVVVLVDVYLPIELWSGWQFPKSSSAAAALFRHLRCDWVTRYSILSSSEGYCKYMNDKDISVWDLANCHVLGCKQHWKVTDSSKQKLFELHEIFKSLPSLAKDGKSISSRIRPNNNFSSESGIWDLSDDILVNILASLGPIDLVQVSGTCHHLRTLAASIMPCVKLKLFPHQQAAVEWMLQRERNSGIYSHPLYSEFLTEDGFAFYINNVSGEILTGMAPTVRDFRGGMICDEPGLGKTITALSLILKTQGTLAEPPDGAEVIWCTHNGDKKCGYYETGSQPGNRSVGQKERRRGFSIDELMPSVNSSCFTPKRTRLLDSDRQSEPVANPCPAKANMKPQGFTNSTPATIVVRCSRSVSLVKKNLFHSYGSASGPGSEQKSTRCCSKSECSSSRMAGASIDKRVRKLRGLSCSKKRRASKDYYICDETWVQCDACRKWRRLSKCSAQVSASAWFCSMNDDPLYQSCDISEEPWDYRQPITYLPGFCEKGTSGGLPQNVSFFAGVLKEHNALLDNSLTKKALLWLAKLSPEKLSEMETTGLVRPGLLSTNDANDFHKIFRAFGLEKKVEKGISRWFYPRAIDNLVFDLAALRLALIEPLDSTRAYLSRATLIVVPPNLVDHWVTQIQKHVKPGQLQVLVWKGHSMPSAHNLAWDYDVVITTFTRLSVERNSNNSALKQVHWLRVILDEGHTLSPGSNVTNKLRFLVSLTASNRWLLTGTPTPNTPNTQLSHLQPMLRFLHEEVYGQNQKSWEAGILKPFEAEMEEGWLRLLQLLNRCMVCARKVDLQCIPPCIKKTTYLDFTEQHAKTYNELVVTVRRNILMADWNDPSHVESLLNPKQWKFRATTIKNVRLSCCVAGHIKVAEAGHDVQETMDVLVENGLDSFSEEYAFIRYNLLYGGNCQRCQEWCRLPIITPCRHFLCLDCVALDSQKCVLPGCGHLYEMQNPETLARPENPNPKWPVPKDLIELQPSYKQDNWDPDWQSTSSSKVTYLVHKLKEIQAANKRAVCMGKEANSDVEGMDQFVSSAPGRQWHHFLPQRAYFSTSFGSFEAPPDKVLIFSQFLEHIHVMEQQLTFAGIKFVGMYSPMQTSHKMKSLGIFQQDADCMVLMMDGTGALGLDLSFVSHVFLMEPIWDRSMEEQVISRAHRMGATRPISVETLAMRDTIEEQMLKFLQNADECRRLLKEENDEPELEGERPYKSLHDFADISYLARLQTVRTESMP